MRRGFSLIEIVLVVVIIGTVAAIAAPRYASAIQRYRVWSAAQRLHADLEQAREWARSSGVLHELRIDAGNDSYQIVRVPRVGPEVVRSKTSLAGAPFNAEIGRASFQASDAEIVIDGYGRISSGGKVMVTSDAWSIRVTAASATNEIILGEPTPDADRGAVALGVPAAGTR